MRTLLVLLATISLLALGACGGDDDGGGDKPATDASQPASTGSPPVTEPTTPAPEADAGFPPTYVFSGDEVQKCIEGKGLAAPREEKPPADDKVGQGIVHDRLLIGAKGAEPALRLFMFAAADLAKEQGKLVTKRTPEAQVLGTTILEPLGDQAAEATRTALACLEEQASG